jgi:NTE family protein
MNTTPSSSTHERALVLGGGGSAGNAWLIGVIAGLVDGGLDVTDADLIVGTSAGATAAAQISGASPAELFAATLAPLPQRTGPAPARTGTVPDHMERLQRIIAASQDVADMRRRMGASALELASESEGWSARWRTTVAARLPIQEWPERRVLLTSVDAETGEPVTFDRDSGVGFVDAVAASTSGGPAYNIGERWYIDGGYRTNADNADLAAGYSRVLVLSPLGGRSLHPVGWGTHLAAQVNELRAGGSRVDTIVPDDASLAAFGDNMMDLSARAPAARAGHDQGTALAERLSGLWS